MGSDHSNLRRIDCRHKTQGGAREERSDAPHLCGRTRHADGRKKQGFGSLSGTSHGRVGSRKTLGGRLGGASERQSGSGDLRANGIRRMCGHHGRISRTSGGPARRCGAGAPQDALGPHGTVRRTDGAGDAFGDAVDGRRGGRLRTRRLYGRGGGVPAKRLCAHPFGNPFRDPSLPSLRGAQARSLVERDGTKESFHGGLFGKLQEPQCF